MTDLVCCLSTGKGSWAEVGQLLKQHPWKTVFLITNTFGKEHFHAAENHVLIILEDTQNVEKMRETIKKELKEKISGDVAVNLSSGTGKEHMALISALIAIGVGIRLVIPGENTMQEV